MNTIKLMVVNVERERERHLIGFVFDQVYLINVEAE